MKLDDWEMRAAFGAEDWPRVISIMESAFGISLAGRRIHVMRDVYLYSEIIAFVPETGADYFWNACGGFDQMPAGSPIGETVLIFTPRSK